MQIQLGDISHIIQLAIAPVFLLTGVGTNLMVLTNRLARIIDRARVLEDRIHKAGRADPFDSEEINVLYRRGHLINRAITLSTLCALLVCLVIAALFIGDAFDLNLGGFIGSLFVLAMLSLIGSLFFFMREIFIATRTLTLRRVHPPLP
ncbi:hypothetical protein RCH09_001836 [Actimicrobium sp. GrIS 1.19]|uniref:DUF2721 domain-containing protein n=1 Tax=Actimicrobium sp. GrIS 1.19 TaxID=3071708 RepID=UPI002E0B9014|nr:hypothetical protein [Actimicrobium sp. GrIS 1.19]